MQGINRRYFMGAVGVASLAAVFPSISIHSETLTPVGTREFDISQFDRMLLPREHGQLSEIKTDVLRRYPSRDHCMQMAAFFNDKKGMLVIANDPEGGTADWQVVPGVRLKIRFYERVPDVIVMDIEPTIEAAAAAYRKWAAEQYWMKGRNRSAPELNFVSFASSSHISYEIAHQNQVSAAIGGKLGVWLTQWRRFPFDVNYPDYTAREPNELPKLLSSIDARGNIAFPHINGLIWDRNWLPYKVEGEKIAIRNQQKDTVYYKDYLDHLRYACPFCRPWQDLIVTARKNVKDSNGRMTKGVYLDMLAATAPISCWATDHGHRPGDLSAWRLGIRQILKETEGLILTEGCAEVYLDLFDYPLMHFHTSKDDIAPLWNLVYGDQVQALGWNLPVGVSSSQFKEIHDRSQKMGLRSLASPWITSEYEGDLFKRNILSSVLLRSPPLPPSFRDVQINNKP